MNGRDEIDLKNELWIQEKLETQPVIINDYMLSTEGDKTSWSRRNYLGYLIQFVKFLEEEHINIDDYNQLASIRPLTINKYMNYISYRYVNGTKVANKAGIKAAKLFAVSDFFEFLVKNDIVESNPCKKIDVPKDRESKEITYLTPEEVKVVQDNIKNRPKGRNKKFILRDLCIVTLGISTGIRVSALTEINVGDIDFERNIITVTEKGKVTREVIIGEKTKDEILSWITERKKILGDRQSDALFINGSGERLSTNAVRSMLRKDTFNINKHITPHKMRSTCGTNLYNMTGDIYLVQHQLGHANIANTRRYAKVFGERLEKAAEALDNIV